MLFDARSVIKATETTAAARAYLERTSEDMGFLFFVLDHLGSEAKRLDAVVDVSARIEQLQLVAYASVAQQQFFCRFIDSFLIYISDLLREILRTKPDILAGTEKIKTERLLKATSLQELVDEIIEEHVSSLSYIGFRELCDWLAKRGIELYAEKSDQPILVEAIAIRNLIVHNRGRIDMRFKSLVPRRALDVGTLLPLELEDIKVTVRTVAKTVSYSDTRAARKFGLQTAPYPPA